MEERLAALEQQVLALEQRLAGLEGRLASGRPGRVATPPSPDPFAEPEDAAPGAGTDAFGFLTHAGRSLIVLGGAYLVRALTENGTLAAGAGVALGLAYALVWLGAAGWAASKGRKGDATFHGLTATAIAFPLVFEATQRFHFLSPGAGALVLALLAILALGLAWRFGHQALAWIVTLATLLTGLALLAATGAVLPFGLCFLVLGLATLWLGYEREWTLLRWLVALVADVVALGLVLRALTPEPRDPPAQVIGLLLALVGSYLASFAARTILRGREVVPFEIAQTAASLLVGLGGALLVARATHAAVAPLGVVSLVLGMAAYVVAHAFLGRTKARGVNFHFWASLALVFVWVGLRLLLSATPLALAFCALAVGGAFFEARFGREAFRPHGLAYLLGAAWVSGLLGDAGTLLFGTPVRPPAAGWAGGFLLLAATASVLLLQWKSGHQDRLLTRAVRLGHLGLLLVLLGSACVSLGLALVERSLDPGAGPGAGPGALATLRTVVFAAAAVALAAATTRWDLPELRGVAWLLLGATGLKILLEDLRRSGPALLFIAFAACGLAFILVPRLLARGRSAPSGGAGDDGEDGASG